MSDHPSTPFTPPPLAENVIDAATEFREHAEAKAREFGQAAGDLFSDWQKTARRVFDDSQGKWKEAGDHAATYVKQNPGKAVLAGLGAGFVIGLLFRQK
ncbi:MAG: hypothetical protein JWM59_4984 [Verrucomicrobiales bacterium]|nr:hypothetical protein [Verrucomicrobiales bacterium]